MLKVENLVIFLVGFSLSILIVSSCLYSSGLKKTLYSCTKGSFSYKKSWVSVLDGLVTFWAWSGILLLTLVLLQVWETERWFVWTLQSAGLYSVVFCYLVVTSNACHRTARHNIANKKIVGEVVTKGEKRVARVLWVLKYFLGILFCLLLLSVLVLWWEFFLSKCIHFGGLVDKNLCDLGTDSMSSVTMCKGYISPSGDFWLVYEWEHTYYRGGDGHTLESSRVMGVSNYFWYISDGLAYTEKGSSPRVLVADFEWGL